jgi:membrane protein YfhO
MIASTTVGYVPESAPMRASWEWITPRRFGIALALIILAAFPEVILGRQTFAFQDFSIFGYPIASYHRECFWRGEMPLWNPLNSFGLPFVAQWNTMTLYPLSLIYLLLPLPWSLNVFCLLHLFLGGMGMFYLMSRWTGCRLAAASAGLGYTFCGLLLVALVWPNTLAVLCWLPWVLYAVEAGWKEGGMRLWVAAFVAALQMLAGHPEYTLLTWLLVGGLWLIQRPTWASSRRLVALMLVVTGLIAVQLLPFVELLLQSQRRTMFEASAWSLPVWGWANFFVPLFHTRAVPQGVYFPSEQPFLTSYYVTLPLVIMAAYGVIFVRDRKVWFFSGTAALGFWLALGKSGYLYKWLLALSPILGAMRYPIKFLALTIVALPILASFGIAHWTSSATESRHRRTLLMLAGGCAALICAIMLYAHFRPVPRHDGPPVWWNGLSRLIFLAGGAGLLLALKRQFQNAQAHLWCSLALLGCIALDCFTQVPKQNPTAPRNVYAPGALAARINNPPRPGEGRAFMSRATHDFLYYNMLPDPFEDLTGRRLGLFGNLNLIDNVATPDGFYSMYVPAARQIWKNLFFAPVDRFPAPLADFAGITHMTDPTNILEWIARPQAMPLASAGQQPRFRDDKTNLLGVVHKLFDPRTMVYLQNDDRQFVTVTNKTDAKVISQRWRAHKIEVEVEATEPSLVVIAQTYYRPWQAFVDGARTRIVRANYAFQALQVPAGRHSVRLVYEDSLFALGAVISLVTLAAAVLGVFWTRRLSNRASGDPTLPSTG